MGRKRCSSLIALVLASVAPLLAVGPVHAGYAEAGSIADGNLLVVQVRGGIQSGSGYAGITQDTLAGGNFYVSNAPNAFNDVLVRVRAASSGDDVTVTVANLGGQPKTLVLEAADFIETMSGQDHYWYEGAFTVAEAASTPHEIAASDGHRIRVAYAGGAGSQVLLTVDATPPAISALSPVHGIYLRQEPVQLTGSIADTGSGIRTDAACSPNASGPGCASDVAPFDAISVAWVDADQNGFTGGEPRKFTDNRSADIRVRFGLDDVETNFFSLDDDISWLPSWSPVDGGFTFAASPALQTAQHAVETFAWMVQARDRAGNLASTSSGPSQGAPEPSPLPWILPALK